MTTHIGRSFSTNQLELLCPCPLEPCGLVDDQKIDPSCGQHPTSRSKTIRQAHWEKECPGPPSEEVARESKEAAAKIEIMREILLG